MQVNAKTFRVFTNKEGEFGNPVGIVIDEKNELNSVKRIYITKRLGFSESVFINNLNGREISIYNPQEEVSFAGHALVGTAFHLKQLLGESVGQIKCKAGMVSVRESGDTTWISANLKDIPPWEFLELSRPDEVDDLSNEAGKKFEHTVVWAWADKNKGVVRARTFAPDWEIPEDEANGSGSMQLASMLDRELEINHGKGSVIYARPLGDNIAEVGGKVVEDSDKLI